MDQVCTLEMTVHSTGSSRGLHFLNSARSFRDDDNFTVVVTDALESEVCERLKVKSLGELEGKRIRVTGRVTSYQGKPQIRLKEADQVQRAE
jgi:DNA/RNA endonuclease YhcR with UshA esterase domain